MSRYSRVYQSLISNTIKLVLTLNFRLIKLASDISYLIKSREIRYKVVSWKMQADLGILINRFLFLTRLQITAPEFYVIQIAYVCFWFIFVSQRCRRTTTVHIFCEQLYHEYNFMNWKWLTYYGENVDDLENESIRHLAKEFQNTWQTSTFKLHDFFGNTQISKV